MLVVPNLDALRKWAKARGAAPAATTRALVARPRCSDKIEREVKKTLRDLAQFEMPKKVRAGGAGLHIESGRADADAQGEAARRGEELPGADRGGCTPRGDAEHGPETSALRA